jgi:hypothetical protein
VIDPPEVHFQRSIARFSRLSILLHGVVQFLQLLCRCQKQP